MLPYYTLSANAHRLALGAKPLADGPLIEIDPVTYAEEVALKAAILAGDHAYYYQVLPQSAVSQWETLAQILLDLCRHYPQDFNLACAGDMWEWHNHLLGVRWHFRYGDSSTLPWAPLDWVGRQVQEDLLLLDGNSAACSLVAGQLCFANRWSLEEKMGRSFLDIHAPVPGFGEQIGPSSNLLLARLKVDRPVWRYNWSLVVGGELDLSTKMYPAVQARMPAVTAANCGELCYFRTERQTLARLPLTGAVLFTIHTYRTPLGCLASDPAWAGRFLEVLDGASPALLAYKGVASLAGPLHEYLSAAAGLV
jgi:dimethylamine monooxygenase subunit A